MFDEDKRYKIVICDDDETFIDLLSEKIEQDFVQRKLVCLIEKYSDSRKLLDNIGAETQLYFLDIDMPEFTGFDVAEILRKQRRDCYIIFVTNHNELVYGSMEFQPFYFIQKSSVSRLNKDVVNVLNKLSVYLKQHQKIIMSDEEHGRICIQYRDILYIESDNHHVKYCILDEYVSQIHIKVRAVIGDLESELAEYEDRKSVV